MIKRTERKRTERKRTYATYQLKSVACWRKETGDGDPRVYLSVEGAPLLGSKTILLEAVLTVAAAEAGSRNCAGSQVRGELGWSGKWYDADAGGIMLVESNGVDYQAKYECNLNLSNNKCTQRGCRQEVSL
jgi:hypothetical protein